MPSQLVGLFKTLTWNDFPGLPDPKQPALDAFTSASFNLPVMTPVKVPGTTGFQFQDNVVITISMSSSKSWKRQANLTSKGAKYASDLLEHEQRHYDIVALIARDLFIEIMQLKGNTYPNPPAALADLRPIVTKFHGKAEKISPIYDSVQQTNHGKNSSQQATWNAMIRKSFTDLRSPAMSAPDGTPYKVQFLDVLSQNGIKP
jgi:hypothetical protein